MEKKRLYIILFSSILAVVCGVILLLAAQNSDYRTKNFAEALDINKKEVTKIVMGSLVNKGEVESTKDERDIAAFLDYFDQLEYRRLSGDKTAYMPMSAVTIYIYEGEESNFIVPYGKEAMINYKVYQIKGGEVEKQFLVDFYEQMKEK